MTTNFPQQHRCVYLASSLTTKRTSSSVPVTKATLFSCKPDKNVITNYSFLLEVKLFFMLFMFKFKSCNQNVAINLKKICNGSLIAPFTVDSWHRRSWVWIRNARGRKGSLFNTVKAQDKKYSLLNVCLVALVTKSLMSPSLLLGLFSSLSSLYIKVWNKITRLFTFTKFLTNIFICRGEH